MSMISTLKYIIYKKKTLIKCKTSALQENEVSNQMHYILKKKKSVITHTRQLFLVKVLNNRKYKFSKHMHSFTWILEFQIKIFRIFG